MSEFDAIDASIDAHAESIPDSSSAVADYAPSSASEGRPENHGQQLERALNSPPADRRGTNGQFRSTAPAAQGDEQDDYPKSYVAQYRDYWKNLTPDFRGYLSQREQEAHGKISEMGQSLRDMGQFKGVAETFYGVSQRYQHTIPQGMPHHVAYEHMLAAQDALERNPREALQHLAQHYGIDFSAPSETSLRTSVERFAQDKEFFAELEDDIADQIKVIKAREPNAPVDAVLQQAYERATRINPKVSTALETKRRTEEEAKRAEENRKKADEARRISRLNVRSTPAATNRGAGRTWEQTLEDTAENVYRR